MTGLPLVHLHMIIHGFVFKKGSNPAHEHHLQVTQRSQAWFSAIYRDLKTTPHNGLMINLEQKRFFEPRGKIITALNLFRTYCNLLE